MYKHILVPLDGSPLAEQVLPHVESLAQHSPGADVTLLMSLPSDNMAHPGIFSHEDQRNEGEYQKMRDYLKGIASNLQLSGFGTSIHISDKPAAAAIIDYAEQHPIDLIVIATHGRSGIGRWVFGSVTQKVMQAARIPVLVVRPRAK